MLAYSERRIHSLHCLGAGQVLAWTKEGVRVNLSCSWKPSLELPVWAFVVLFSPCSWCFYSYQAATNLELENKPWLQVYRTMSRAAFIPLIRTLFAVDLFFFFPITQTLVTVNEHEIYLLLNHLWLWFPQIHLWIAGSRSSRGCLFSKASAKLLTNSKDIDL